MKNLALINQFPVSKEELSGVAEQIKQDLIDHPDPIGVHIKIKAMEELLRILKKDEDVQEALKEGMNGSDKVKKWGASVTRVTRETPVYETCDDPVYNELQDDLEKTKDLIKKREKYLNSLDGEVDYKDGIKILPPVRVKNSYFRITLDK